MTKAHVRFCWIPSHCGIEGNERVDQLARETLDHDIDSLANVHHADLKPLVNSYIQQLVQIKWDVAVHGRDLYLLKPKLGPPTKFQHLTRAEEVVIARLRIGRTKATKSHILSHGPPTTCHHCVVIRHWLLTICSWSVQCCRQVATNTTQLTHWILSLRQLLRLALWNSCKKQDSSIWYEWSDILYNPSLEQSLNWCIF